LKKIICYKLRHEDKDLLGDSVKKYEDFEIQEENQKAALLKLEKDDLASLFIHIDDSIDSEFLETLLKKYNNIPVNVIFKYKDFDLLILCYKYQVSSIFESKLKQPSVENALLKIDFLSRERKSSLPVTDVVKLFSSPVKIKNNLEFYNRVTGYLNSFKTVQNIALIEFDDDHLNWIGPVINGPVEEKVREEELARKFIGQEVLIEDNGLFVVATPVFCKDAYNVWLVVELKESDKDYIFNNLFYKYLENILIYRMNKEKEQNLEVLATTDEITGLYNQRKLATDLEEAVALHEKQHETFSIMFIDVDHFKSVNDNYGHVVGSKLLQDIGEVLSLILRSSDHIYRYGGDEFVVIMPTVEIATVHDIAKRVLYKIKNKEFDIGNGEKYRLSVSVGLAEYPTDAKSALEIIKFADEMMYMSKRSGRGKVFHVNEVEDVDASSE
jgi:diguanylate cyclase (GGDEF)-like protein